MDGANIKSYRIFNIQRMTLAKKWGVFIDEMILFTLVNLPNNKGMTTMAMP